MSFGEHMCTFLVGMYLGVELFSKSICTCSVLVDTAKQFPEVVVTKDFLSFLNLLEPEGKGCRGRQVEIWLAVPASKCRLKATLPSPVPLFLSGIFLFQGTKMPPRCSWLVEFCTTGA